MAYIASITITHHGGRDYTVTIQETEAGAATEAVITGLPRKGRIVAQRAQLIAGTATTIDPVIGTTTDPASNFTAILMSNATAAAGVSNQALPEVGYANAPTLYHRSICDAGSDNTVATVYLIKAGW